MKINKNLFSRENTTGASELQTHPKHIEDRQAGSCHIQCLNVVVYTEWLNKSTYILGKHAAFIPHHKTNQPHHLTQTQTREVIAQKIQAMHNSALTNPSITDKNFNCTMPTWEEKLDGKLATMMSTIKHSMEMHGGNNRHNQSLNGRHHYGYGSNDYKSNSQTNSYNLYYNLWLPPSQPTTTQLPTPQCTI